jgi:hypothetical protein
MSAAKSIQAKAESGIRQTGIVRRSLPPRPAPRADVAPANVANKSVPPPLPRPSLHVVTTVDPVEAANEVVEEITSVLEETTPLVEAAARAGVELEAEAKAKADPEVSAPVQLRGRGVQVVWFVKTVGFFVSQLVLDGARAVRARVIADWARASERAQRA